MENYQKLKEIIQKANPEIMELKFGCIVSNGINEYFCLDNVYVLPYVNVKPQVYWKHFPKHINDLKPAESVKILGRPIRLADVLLAIDYQQLTWAVDECGYFMEMTDVTENGKQNIYAGVEDKKCWNLKDDNLDNQSPECKQFLIKLLC